MYLNQTSSEVYFNESYKADGHFELLNVIPADHLLFSWKGEAIFDNFQTRDYRFIELDDEHVYIRSFHKFFLEQV